MRAGFVMLMMPLIIMKMRRLRPCVRLRVVGRINPGHCLSMGALAGRRTFVWRSLAAEQSALRWRHCCQSSVENQSSSHGRCGPFNHRDRGRSNPLKQYPERGGLAQRRQPCHDIRNPLIIDLPKATKGRRMSKQTRKKSSKSAASKAAGTGTKAVAKKSSKTGTRTKASTITATGRVRQPAPSLNESLHKLAAKALRASTGKSTTPAAAAKVGGLSEGGKAPAFTLPRDGGSSVTLKSFAGRKLVIFFYPRASTPGCTREAIDFTRLLPEFEKAGVSVLGASADAPAKQEKFRDKYELKTPLASDEPHAMLEAYGAWGEKSLYGKKFQGILRTTVLIDSAGRIERIWRNVKVDGHAEAVLAAAKER
jgi:peroxiredoxin Q/BCP